MVTALVEKLPDFLSFGVDVLQAILQGIIDNLPTLLDGLAQVVEEIFVALVELAPSLLDAGIELLKYIADGIKNGIPSLVEKLPEIISSISEYFTENLPSILDTGADILISLIDGIVSAIPILMENLPQILTSIIDFIVENLPEIIGTGVEILTALVYGIISAIPSIVLALPDVVKAILDGFAQLPQMLFDIGANIIQGLIDGFLSMVGNVVDAIGSVIDAIFGTAEKEAEVHSPSKRGERLGKNIDQGIANGLEGNAASVKSAVSRLDVLSELERAMPNIERRVTLVNDGMVPGSVAATTVRETADTNKSGEVYGNSSQRVKLDIGFYPREASMFLRPYLRDEDRRSGTDLVE